MEIGGQDTLMGAVLLASGGLTIAYTRLGFEHDEDPCSRRRGDDDSCRDRPPLHVTHHSAASLPAVIVTPGVCDRA